MKFILRWTRWWFRCPRQGCDRRCECLHLPPPFRGGFACRRCWNLTYRSTQETYKEREEARF
jgi:hypothetical protein